MWQCVCDVGKDTGKAEYLRPFVRIGLQLDWVAVAWSVCNAPDCRPDMELGHILRPSDPVTRESSDPEIQLSELTRWPCSIMNSKRRLMLQTNTFSMGKRFASFYRCLAFARFWKVKFWRSFIKCEYYNDGWTDFHKKYISLYFYIGLLSKTGKNSGLTPSQNDDPVTSDPDIKDDPNDPLTRWPNDPVPCLLQAWVTLERYVRRQRRCVLKLPLP